MRLDKKHSLVVALAFAATSWLCACGSSSSGERAPDGGPTGGSGGTAGSGGSSGSGGSGGSSGSGGFPQLTSDKLDLLLVVDNSISMADKQSVLRLALAEMVDRLTNPLCVDANKNFSQAASPSEPCPSGANREFQPVRDMHVGVLSSSLGGHGSNDVCKPTSPTDPVDDRGELIAPRRGLTSYQSHGFLVWDPEAKSSPPGESNVQTLTTDLQAEIVAVGEQGCGFEATHESWYRFLVDPNPPDVVRQDGGLTVQEGTNQTILNQRAAFLRPDSAVMIVVLSDENDCSIRDEAQTWLVGYGDPLPNATSACASNPNDMCCRSCAQSDVAGCPTTAQDPACQAAPNPQDTIFLRCWDQKRRFGISFLHPVDRYVSALTDPQVVDRDGNSAENPLFGVDRNPSLVSLTTISGVPWQDIARPGQGDLLEYMSASELQQQNRWDVILGDFDNFGAPLDPLMIESVTPRSGTNPVTGLSPAAPSSGYLASPVNGHEKLIPSNDDLQYSCIFPLPQSRDCTSVPTTQGCDCRDASAAAELDPLCQSQAGSYGTVQNFGKAYPGTRHLAITRELRERGVTASVCPRQLSDSSRQDYGYRPAIRAMLERLSGMLR